MNKTLSYYNSNAEDFFKSTVNADMTAQYQRFEKYLSPGDRILDLGCGSGRDTKHFLEAGYQMKAVDGSEELCQKASEYTGIEVENIRFQDMAYNNEYHGVWACASLLHLTSAEIEQVMERIKRALLPGGILYTSFKLGDFEGERNGRYFTDFTEETFRELIDKIGDMEIVELYLTSDVRPRRGEEKWVNGIVMHKSYDK